MNISSYGYSGDLCEIKDMVSYYNGKTKDTDNVLFEIKAWVDFGYLFSIELSEVDLFTVL